ncbi:MAG: hypothetical protein GY790_16240 [Bacteroidetes bacterium]|nr:hypothetical protein [Bacteroidota bacterium]
MRKLYAILIFALGFSAHTISQEVVKLAPLAPEGNFVNGREYIPLSSDQIRLELGYEGVSEESLVLDLVVFNETGHKISVNPSDFYYLSLDNPDADSSRFPPMMAEAPQQLYKWYDRALEKQESEKNFNIFEGFAEAGAEIISGFEAVFNTAGTPGHYGAVNKQIDGEREQLAREKEVIRQETMKEVGLAPGEITNGFVCFPGHPETAYLMFCFPIDGQEFQFVYQRLPFR